jgi:hypothetical protein
LLRLSHEKIKKYFVMVVTGNVRCLLKMESLSSVLIKLKLTRC